MMNLRRRRRPVPMIPIVSLIDILVILLIFFIATTTFRLRKTYLRVALPESKAMGGTAAKPEERTAITITKEQKVYLAGALIDSKQLADALTKLRAAKPETKLELEADTESALGILIQVWDALRTAGYSIQEVPARIQRAATP